VHTAMLLPDQAGCVMKAVQKRRPEDAVLVAPLFLSEGYFTEQVIPQRLQGFDYRYNGRAMLPHPLVSRWMERRIRERLDVLRADRGLPVKK
jgi:sirohydrochlorin cobaltochelatase